MIPFRSCCVVVCVSRLSLTLSLSDRVPVVVVLVALGGRQDVMVTKMLIEDVSTLLLMIKDC